MEGRGRWKKKVAPRRELPTSAEGNKDWNQFRGPTRDGRVAWLPDTLPDSPSAVWTAFLSSSGIGGIAATGDYVIVGSRDSTDKLDVFQAFSAQSGKLLWQYRKKAEAQLDYGNSPRTTPLIWGPCVFTLGALGDLACLDLESGIPLWQKSLLKDFGGKLPAWGYSGSPIMHDERLFVQPGGPSAAVAALDPITGETLWKTKGNPAAYASLSIAHQQLIGLDSAGVVGWHLSGGDELWRIKPQIQGDFGVPTPLVTGDRLLLTSENNGTRLHEWKDKQFEIEYDSINERPSPDSQTPVVVGNRAFIADGRLYCLSLEDDLQTLWTLNERAFRGYSSLLATEDRLLALTASSELLLIDIGAPKGELLDRLKLSDKRIKTLSHPAIVGKRLYARIGQSLMCIEL